jgi:chromosome partitioning protein
MVLEEIREDHNNSLEIEGIIINQFQARAKLPQAAVDELSKTGLPVVKPYISSSVKMKESHASKKPLIHMAPSHKLSLEFVDLFSGLDRKDRKHKKAS